MLSEYTYDLSYENGKWVATRLVHYNKDKSKIRDQEETKTYLQDDLYKTPLARRYLPDAPEEKIWVPSK